VRFGLIPPIPDLHRIPRTGLHLVLSHQFNDPTYEAYYRLRRHAGDYLILDNGAHELGAGQEPKDLLLKAASIQAQEVVLPDVLFDRRGTVHRSKRMLKWLTTYDGWATYVNAGMPRFMFVPQGTNMAEWATCLKHLFQAWDLFTSRMPEAIEDPVVGISKDYDTWRGGLKYLIERYVAPWRSNQPFDVHCLGWPSNLWTLAEVCRTFPWIRSTDSAKPFVYAKAGILLEPGGKVPKYPRRDPEYFNEPLTFRQWNIALRNVEVFRATATDMLIPSAYPVDSPDPQPVKLGTYS
jgi:hypothetical protein